MNLTDILLCVIVGLIFGPLIAVGAFVFMFIGAIYQVIVKRP